MENGISIGANSKSVEKLVNGILAILKTNADQTTKQVALDTLKNGTSVGTTNISNCTLTGN